MKHKTILVPEIHLFNWIIFYCLSHAMRVVTCRVSPVLKPLPLGRIEFVDWEKYVGWEEKNILFDRAVDLLAQLGLYEEKPDSAMILGRKVDLKAMLLQRRSQALTVIVFGDAGRSAGLVFIDDALTAMIRRQLYGCCRVGFWATLNIALQYINFLVENILFFGRGAICLWRGVMCLDRRSLKVAYVYDGVSPRELSADSKDISFSWIIDGEKIRREDVFFILPRPDFQMRGQAYVPCSEDGFRAAYHAETFHYFSTEALWAGFQMLGGVFLRACFSLRLMDIIRVRVMLEMVPGIVLCRSLRPKVYIMTSSVCGGEPAHIPYLNAEGVRTVIWSYGTNSYLFQKNGGEECRFRLTVFAYIASNFFIVWNEHYAQYVREHPQLSVDIRVIGPLMSGDESIVQMGREAVFTSAGISYDPRKKYIGVFDCPLPVAQFRRRGSWFPEAVDDEYNHALLADVYKIVKDSENLVLVYKPKRSLASGKFSYAKEMLEIFEQMRNDPSVIMLDYNINPWVPVALVDVAISAPFESPNIAVMHYGKESFFYDPFGIVNIHRYNDSLTLILKGRNELRERIQALFADQGKQDMHPAYALLQGRNPCLNSSGIFREFLQSL